LRESPSGSHREALEQARELSAQVYTLTTQITRTLENVIVELEEIRRQIAPHSVVADKADSVFKEGPGPFPEEDPKYRLHLSQ
jgi:hypothetical protein